MENLPLYELDEKSSQLWARSKCHIFIYIHIKVLLKFSPSSFQLQLTNKKVELWVERSSPSLEWESRKRDPRRPTEHKGHLASRHRDLQPCVKEGSSKGRRGQGKFSLLPDFFPGGFDKHRLNHLDSTLPGDDHLQDRPHLVSIWRTELQDQVWLLVL